MRIILSWVLTPLFLLSFGGILLLLHPFQILGRYGGERTRLLALEGIHAGVLLALKVIGVRLRTIMRDDIPKGRPIIIVSNHQSMFDIPFLHWTFRECRPTFIAKKELGRFIPSISYALRSGAGILIDRSDPVTSVEAISELAAKLQERNGCVSIFPEGTRARDGKIKKFKPKGLIALLEKMPDAVIVPAAISRSWELVQHGFLPVPFGITVSVKSLEPIYPPFGEPEALVAHLQEIIGREVTDGF